MSATLEPVRVAFCITDLDPGGAERALVQLVTRLDRARWQPAVFCLSAGGDLVESLTAANVPCVCLGARRARNVGVIFKLIRELKEFRPRLLQTFLFHANLAGRIAGHIAGVSYIVSGIRVAERRTRAHLWLDRLTNGLVDKNVCVSRGVAEFSIRNARLKPDKITVIGNGVDVCAFAAPRPADRTSLGIPAETPLLVSIGRLDPQKGWLYLLDAVGRLVGSGAKLHWLLVGEGPERSLIERRIAELRLTAHVQLAGWRADIPELLRVGDCFVLSSLWEGMPNVVLEAMAAGLPVVATRVEGLAELVQDEQTGLLVAPGSSDELADAIEKLLADPALRSRMGQAGQAHVRAECTWERMVAQYEALYLSLLNS